MAHLLEVSPWLSSYYQIVDAEKIGFERLYGVVSCGIAAGMQSPSLVNEIKKAREQIQKSLQEGGGSTDTDRISELESENQDLRKVTEDLRAAIEKLEKRVCSLENSSLSKTPQVAQPPQNQSNKDAAEEDDDDDIDLFGDDDEADEEAERLKQQRLKEYEARKSKKPTVVAKSNVILDVKPWDDTTDMKKMEECVRSVKMDGLIWGNSKLVPLAYGIRKLQISCVVEDDKVSTEVLQEQIEDFEDYVQSTDIAAFQKV